MDKKQTPQSQNSPEQDKQQLNSKFAKYTGSTLKVAVVILLFYYLGHWADSKFGFEKPWLAMCGSLLGVGVGIYSLILDLNR
ncbi:MAG: AtpZ/AtpI family protein [Luteibaculum sp.]